MFCASSEFHVGIYEYTKYKFRYNDMSRGVTMNYLARMKRGSSNFKGESFDLSFEPGDIFFIPKGCRYISCWKGEEIVWDSFEFAFFPEKEVYPIQSLKATPEILALYDKIASSAAIGSETIGLIYSLLGLLIPTMDKNESKSYGLVEKATEYIAHNRDFSVQEIAKHCNVSVSSLYSAFKRDGKTPVSVKLELQLEDAISLLKTTELKVEHIAERCGFNSVSYFNRVLKRATGKSPSELRRSVL